MKWKKPRLSSKLLLSYTFSFGGVVLLSCVLVSSLLLNFYIQDFADLNRKSLQNKMTAAADDLENQLDVLENISHLVTTNIEYRPYYLLQGNYYEKEMLEDFSQFTTYSPLASGYFLVYENMENAYRSTGGTCEVSALLESYGEENPEKIGESLKSLRSFQMFEIGDGSQVFLCLPVKFVGNGKAEYAALVFVCSRSTFLQRVDTSVGAFGCSYEVLLNGRQLAVSEKYEAPKQGDLTAVSGKGRFRIDADYSGEISLAGISMLRWVNITALLLCIGALVLGAVGLAYRKFKPIRAISDRIGQKKQENSASAPRDELQEIEDTFKALQTDNSSKAEQLRQQAEGFKQFILRALLEGRLQLSEAKGLESAGIRVTGRYLFCILLLFADSGGTMPNGFSAELIELAEELSDQDTSYYCVCQPEKHGIMVLVSMRENAPEDAAEMLRALIDAKNVPCTLSSGGVCCGMDKIPLSCAEAAEEAKHAESGGPGVFFSVNDLPVAEMLSAAQKGNTEAALQTLGELENQMQGRVDSLLLQRYVFSEITSATVRVARGLKLDVNYQQVGLLITAPDVGRFCAELKNLLTLISGEAQKNSGEREEKLVAGLLKYIDAHYLEYDFSLERLAGEFNLSVSYLSRLIKKVTGENYKDYVIRLKIEKAKEHLAAGIPVAVTNEMIGYANISYFIKTFRQIVGVTPPAYQKSCRQPGNPADGELREK